jgi:hypothetical protein
VIAFVGRWITDEFAIFQNECIVSLLVSGLLYTAMVSVMVFVFPVIVGLRWEDITGIFLRLRSGFGRKKEH